MKVIFNLSQEDIDFIQSQAKKEKIGSTDILCRAINSEKFFVECESLNRKILVEDGSKLREIVRR